MTDWSAVLLQAQAAANAANKESGVNLKGKSYLMVANRVEVFRQHFGVAFTIDTQLVSHDEKHACFRASILDDTGRSVANGYALENYGTTPVNKGNYLENCETSAIGRALAAFGLHGGEYSSVNELEAQQRNVAALAPPPAPDPQPTGVVVDDIADTFDAPAPTIDTTRPVMREINPARHPCMIALRATTSMDELREWHRKTAGEREQLRETHPAIIAAIQTVLEAKQEENTL